jgi:hypothetical protein
MAAPGLDGRINAQDIDAILAFLPRLQSLGPASATKWPEIRRTGEREFTIERGETNPLVLEFIKALYDHGFVRDFNWPKWKPNAERFYEHPDLLKRATMKTCVKLLTVHARADHFTDCHFASMVQSGQIVAILERMAELLANKIGRGQA